MNIVLRLMLIISSLNLEINKSYNESSVSVKVIIFVCKFNKTLIYFCSLYSVAKFVSFQVYIFLDFGYE